MKKILIIEDHETVRETLVDILENEGYQTHTARDGFEGVMRAIDIKPDLTLSDIMMPKLNGFEVYQLLSKFDIVDQRSILFLSAHQNSDGQLKEIGLSEKDKLAKPFKVEALVEAVEKKLTV